MNMNMEILVDAWTRSHRTDETNKNEYGNKGEKIGNIGKRYTRRAMKEKGG